MTADEGKERNNIFSPYYFLVFPRDRGLNLDSLPSLFLPRSHEKIWNLSRKQTIQALAWQQHYSCGWGL